jgi:hypothetical protein
MGYLSGSVEQLRRDGGLGKTWKIESTKMLYLLDVSPVQQGCVVVDRARKRESVVTSPNAARVTTVAPFVGGT